MYYGEYQTTVDDKGRITMPARFREVMRTLHHHAFFMVRGFDGAVSLYTIEEWNRIREEARRHSPMSPGALDFRRMFFGSAVEVQPDGQGRMPVPAHLRSHAGLERDAVVIGLDDHLELWSKARWDAFTEGKETEFKEMASGLFNGSGRVEAEVLKAER